MDKPRVFDPPPEPTVPSEYQGTYRTGSGAGVMELEQGPGGLKGRFAMQGDVLLVRGSPDPSGQLYGELIEPNQAEVIAVFRAWLNLDTLTLELDIPSSGPDFSEAETLHLFRVPTDPDEHWSALGGDV